MYYELDIFLARIMLPAQVSLHPATVGIRLLENLLIIQIPVARDQSDELESGVMLKRDNCSLLLMYR